MTFYVLHFYIGKRKPWKGILLYGVSVYQDEFTILYSNSLSNLTSPTYFHPSFPSASWDRKVLPSKSSGD